MSETANNHALSTLSQAPLGSVVLPAYEAEAQEQERSSTPLSATLRRRWLLMLLTWTAVSGSLAAIVWTRYSVEYEAVGLVRVAPLIRPVLFRDEESGVLPFYNAFLAAQMQSITTTTVLRRAAESPEVRNLPWMQQAGDPVAYLSRKVKVDNPEAGEFITISMMGENPAELAPTVNAVLRAYHDKVRADNESDDTAQLGLLYAEQSKLQDELKRQHDALYSFAHDVGSLSLGDQQDAAFAGMATVQIKLKEAQTARIAAEARLTSLRQRGPNPLSTGEWSQLEQQVLATDSELSMLEFSRQLEEQRLMERAQQLGPDHRDLRLTRDRVENLKKRMDQRRQELGSAVASLADARARMLFEADYRAAEQEFLETEQREKALQEMVREDLSRLSTMGKNAVQLQALREKADLTGQLHSAVAQRIQHLEVEKQRPARVNIDAWASEPTSPARDRRPKFTAVAVAAGFFAALTLAFLVESRDTRVRSADDVRRSVGLTVLGTRTIPKQRQVTNKDVLASVAEEIRGIRGCVLFAGGCQDFRSLLITSPNPREGKTHTAGELAVALAESGRRILLIDADNRKRDLTRQLGADDRPGLADLLANGHTPDRFILTTSTPNLSFLPSGSESETFSELLVRPGQMERIRETFDDYDLVLVDSPPVLACNDACIWARYIDSVLMVLRAKYSAREEALQAKDKLSRMGGRIMGAVLNGVEHPPSYYSRYAYASY